MITEHQKHMESIFGKYEWAKGRVYMKFILGSILLFLGQILPRKLEHYDWFSKDLFSAFTYLTIVVGLSLIVISSICYILLFKSELNNKLD